LVWVIPATLSDFNDLSFSVLDIGVKDKSSTLASLNLLSAPFITPKTSSALLPLIASFKVVTYYLVCKIIFWGFNAPLASFRLNLYVQDSGLAEVVLILPL